MKALNSMTSITSILKHVSDDDGYFIASNTLNITCSSCTCNISFPCCTSMRVLSVAKNGQPSKCGIYRSSSIYETIKSVGKINLSTLTRTSSIIPLGRLIDRSANWSEMVVSLDTS